MSDPADSPALLLARALRHKMAHGEDRVRLSPEERAGLKRFLKGGVQHATTNTQHSTNSVRRPTADTQRATSSAQHPTTGARREKGTDPGPRNPKPEARTPNDKPSTKNDEPGTKHQGLTPESLILPGVGKAEQMEHLRQIALACARCEALAATRAHVVVGVGNLDADLMFVGEAPGADEDRQGEPFVGRAGQLLTKMIETMGLSRADVYIGNVLKCRPDMPKGSTGNRQPTETEMGTCLPYLQAQIAIIRPKVIVTLGGTAIQGLLKLEGGVSWHRGRWRQYGDIPVMPTYHPAYLLRNGSIETKRKVWEDLLAVMERLGMPISEKQRGYFLGGKGGGG